jgi:uncharacterized Fe-S cluster protein YjdI
VGDTAGLMLADSIIDIAALAHHLVAVHSIQNCRHSRQCLSGLSQIHPLPARQNPRIQGEKLKRRKNEKSAGGFSVEFVICVFKRHGQRYRRFNKDASYAASGKGKDAFD